MVGRWRGMKRRSSQSHTLTAVQRGVIVQRVIVDGWTITAVAAAAGLPEPLVAAWVADFRRRGMASLRHRPGKTVVTDFVRWRLLRPVRLAGRGIASSMRWLFALEPLVPLSPIRQSRDDRRGGT